MITAPTPETVSRSSLICLRAISVISCMGRWPDTAICITGMAFRSNLSMIGGSVPTGSCARIVEILSRTSCAATSRFFSRKNCTTTSEMPSLVVDRSSSMPETVLMISSIGLVTLVSISSTLAPLSVVVTTTIGKSTLGNRSTPSRLRPTSPSTIGAETSITVKTGRLMQRSQRVMDRVRKSLGLGILDFAVRPYLHGDAFGQLLVAAGDHLVVRAEVGFRRAHEFHPAAAFQAGGDRHRPHTPVADHKDLRRTGVRHDRVDGYRPSLRVHVREDVHLGESAGFESRWGLSTYTSTRKVRLVRSIIGLIAITSPGNSRLG